MTIFQEQVYKIVQNIPRGKTITYAEIARAIQNPNAARAVGNALNKNHNPAIPCHRVIRSNGEIGGYNKGSQMKAGLLRAEGVPNL